MTPKSRTFSAAELDLKSLALHRLVVQKILSRPFLFDRVRETISRWHEQVDPAARPSLVKWQELVDQGTMAALAVAVEESERGQALRQTSPFTRILSEAERETFMRTWSNSNTRSG